MIKNWLTTNYNLFFKKKKKFKSDFYNMKCKTFRKMTSKTSFAEKQYQMQPPQNQEIYVVDYC